MYTYSYKHNHSVIHLLFSANIIAFHSGINRIQQRMHPADTGTTPSYHDYVMPWKCFSYYWPFVRKNLPVSSGCQLWPNCFMRHEEKGCFEPRSYFAFTLQLETCSRVSCIHNHTYTPVPSVSSPLENRSCPESTLFLTDCDILQLAPFRFW